MKSFWLKPIGPRFVARLGLTGALLSVFALLGAALPGQVFADDQPVAASPAGSFANVELTDGRTPPVTLAVDESRPVVVVAFLGTECPVAKLYAVTLSEIAKTYHGRGVMVYGVDANSQDSLEEIAAMVRRQELPFPVYRDAGNVIADRFGAERTPEVFVLDAERTVKYHGRIDDRFGVGYVKDIATTHELTDAIDAVLAGKNVKTPMTEAIGCQIGRVKTPDETAAVTWHGQIATLLEKRCVACHRTGDIGPFALTDYAEAAGWADMIAEVVAEKRMPPWHASPEHGKFINDTHLSDDELRLIADWVSAGAPEGEPQPRTETVAVSDGWQLPTPPDASFNVQAKPFPVPASGEVKYQWFSIDPKFTEEKWVKAIEIVPGTHTAVHHVLAFAIPEGQSLAGSFGGGAHGFLAGYVPGLRVQVAADGMAKRIPAGSRLVFQVHYTPTGTPQTDVSKIGLWFVDPDTVTREIKTVSALQTRIKIPPGAAAHTVTGMEMIEDEDALLLGFMPHMHLRGSAFRYELVAADSATKTDQAEKEILLDIPHYDFNWQTSYRLAEPRPLPVGTTIIAHGTFDNSTRNLSNPDPKSWVSWGDQTWEEMMIGYFDISVPRKHEQSKADVEAEAEREKVRRVDLAMGRLDADGDGKITLDEANAVPRAKKFFVFLDSNGDGFIDRKELAKISHLLIEQK